MNEAGVYDLISELHSDFHGCMPTKYLLIRHRPNVYTAKILSLLLDGS